MAKGLMIQGTGSDVGKTLLIAGLCRLLANRGLRVASFKPQNMSNNAAVATDGGEIGRGQALQAFAARIAPSHHMNPVLLKPQPQGRAQLIIQGRAAGTAGGAEYQRGKGALLGKVLDSYQHLAAHYEYILAEGAGSPAEVNLRAGDIANMGFARAAGLPVAIVGDIDRGGVIAALAGTHCVLEAADRAQIRGFIINKFRGEQSLFADGAAAISRFTGWPCLGIVPWLAAAELLPAEDSLALSRLAGGAGAGGAVPETNGPAEGGRRVRILAPLFPHIANFDDFDPLRHDSRAELIFIPAGQKPDLALLASAQAIILGGSKAALADLQSLRASGWAAAIAAFAAAGGAVIGLCGGLQMLGRRLLDPQRTESSLAEAAGLGLLDMETVLAPGKIVARRRAHSRFFDAEVEGYEIHCGRSFGPACATPPFEMAGKPEGAATADGRIWGTYLHGIFANGNFRSQFLRRLGGSDSAGGAGGEDYAARLDRALNAIAGELERALDIKAILAIMAQGQHEH